MNLWGPYLIDKIHCQGLDLFIDLNGLFAAQPCRHLLHHELLYAQHERQVGPVQVLILCRLNLVHGQLEL